MTSRIRCKNSFPLLVLALSSLAMPAQTAPSRSSRAEPILIPPNDAPYLLPDGSVYIAGNDLIEPFLDAVNDRFIERHPGFKFKMDSLSSGLLFRRARDLLLEFLALKKRTELLMVTVVPGLLSNSPRSHNQINRLFHP